MRLYATCKEHCLPRTEDINSQHQCLLDLSARKKWRAKYPGACALEYESMIQIVIKILIGWNSKDQKGTNGIFGVPLAYADCCEEQARYTLHSHISVWIKNFNKVRDLLFHSDSAVRLIAKTELEKYFQTIAQATFHDLYDIDTTSTADTQKIHKLGEILRPPCDQDLRRMRHHIHCKDLHGVVGYHPHESDTSCLPCDQDLRRMGHHIHCKDIHGVVTSNTHQLNTCSVNKDINERRIDCNNIVKRNTRVFLGSESSINDFNKQQLDMLSYTYPYHMKNCGIMKPHDCQNPNDSTACYHTLDEKLKQFNLRYPLLQLRFNIHDCYHRPSCFKKGPECRTELPQKHRTVATIQFDEDNSINWYFIDGSVKKNCAVQILS